MIQNRGLISLEKNSNEKKLISSGAALDLFSALALSGGFFSFAKFFLSLILAVLHFLSFMFSASCHDVALPFRRFVKIFYLSFYTNIRCFERFFARSSLFLFQQHQQERFSC